MNRRPAHDVPVPRTALALVVCAFALLYAGLPSARHHLDGIWHIALLAEDYESRPVTDFLRASYPSHFLYDLLVVLGWKAFVACGYTGRALYALAFVTALIGVAGIGLFARCARRLGAGGVGAVVCSFGLGASAGWWMYANNLEDILPSVVVWIAAFDCAAAAARDDSRRRWIAVALLAGLSALLHQTGVVLFPSLIVLGFAFGKRAARDAALAAFGAFSLAGLVLIAVGLAFGRFDGPPAFFSWLFYHQVEWSGGWGEWRVSGSLLARTLGRLLVEHPTTRTAALAVAACALAGWGIVRAIRSADDDRRAAAAVSASLLIWIAAAVAFGIYWHSGDPEFFLAALPALWLCVAAGMRPESGRRAFALVAAGLGACLFAVNLLGAAIPDSAPRVNPAFVQSRALAEQVRPGDLVIIPSYEWPAVYMRYFYDVDVVSLRFEMTLPRVGSERLADAVGEAEKAARERGGTVWQMGMPDPRDPGWRGFFETQPDWTGLTPLLVTRDVGPAFRIGREAFYRVPSPD